MWPPRRYGGSTLISSYQSNLYLAEAPSGQCDTTFQEYMAFSGNCINCLCKHCKPCILAGQLTTNIRDEFLLDEGGSKQFSRHLSRRRFKSDE
jgi:hypothetical protein